ncbi:hypothetical protein NE282_10285 [Leuconostoc mesenteroides]|uniref:hypothetical protein n=1 Tax=Leuconostoc mesenteroides TaxID=1245 RepID=UPI00207431AA|nr:hypothetical protein [Leuconostoc mesenteroides]
MVGFIVIVLIGYIFEQHRRIHYLVKQNIEQENLKVIQDHQYDTLKHLTNMLDNTLKAFGYDYRQFDKNNFVKHELTPEQIQQLWRSQQREIKQSDNEVTQFDVELKKGGLYAWWHSFRDL